MAQMEPPRRRCPPSSGSACGCGATAMSKRSSPGFVTKPLASPALARRRLLRSRTVQHEPVASCSGSLSRANGPGGRVAGSLSLFVLRSLRRRRAGLRLCRELWCFPIVHAAGGPAIERTPAMVLRIHESQPACRGGRSLLGRTQCLSEHLKASFGQSKIVTRLCSTVLAFQVSWRPSLVPNVYRMLSVPTASSGQSASFTGRKPSGSATTSRPWCFRRLFLFRVREWFNRRIADQFDAVVPLDETSRDVPCRRLAGCCGRALV